MASGDTLCVFLPQGAEFPAANYATLDTRNNHPVLDFDAATDEAAYWTDVMPRNYGGGGITAYIHYAMTTAITLEVIWLGAFERIGDGFQDLDIDGFAADQTTAAITVPGTAGNVDITPITFTNGAQMDSIAVGELFRFRLTRDANAVGDDAAGDAEVVAIELKET